MPSSERVAAPLPGEWASLDEALETEAHVKDVRLEVRPAPGGWRLDCDLPLERTYFSSGDEAQNVARALAVHLSCAGYDVQVVVADQSSLVVGTRRYFAIF